MADPPAHGDTAASPGVTAIVDYGMGNLRSVLNAFDQLGRRARLASSPGEVRSAERIVIPGVGAFGDGMAALRERGLDVAVRDAAGAGWPILGICLGMQLLATQSDEHGLHRGLDLIPGRVERLSPPDGLRVPHVGWNDLHVRGGGSPLLSDLDDEATFYYVHSYEFRPTAAASISAVTDYGGDVVACVGRGRVWGVQFHPEKSGRDGLGLLERFATV
jgi:glutamine amidotransferase